MGLDRLHLKAAVHALMTRLENDEVYVHVPHADRDYAVEAGLRMLLMRHIVTENQGHLRIAAGEAAIVRYYANSIAHLLWENTVTPALVAELEARYQVVTVKNSAIVCAIGSNISIPGVLARAAQALADAQINVNCVSQTLRQVNMQFIIERSDYKQAIIALNHSLCVIPGMPVPRA